MEIKEFETNLANNINAFLRSSGNPAYAIAILEGLKLDVLMMVRKNNPEAKNDDSSRPEHPPEPPQAASENVSSN